MAEKPELLNNFQLKSTAMSNLTDFLSNCLACQF